ncbi:MAG: P1 family peptidase [Clostridiaceae bacterium]
MNEISIYDIEDFKIGHAGNLKAATGCTIILCKNGATAGVDVRGGAPGTRETDLLNPVNLVDKIHGVMLSGGSAFGLDAASGAMQYLEENNIGFDVSVTKVPIVCSAVLFDLTIGNHKIRPDKTMGYEACLNSEKNIKYKDGNIGAGAGATLGKILGPSFSMKGGLGTYAIRVGDLEIGAIVSVNCLGDVYEDNKIIAGAYDKENQTFLDTEKILIDRYDNNKNLFSGNTTIGTIITNAKITKSQASKISSMAHNGYARCIKPSHTMFDGDSIFTMASGKIDCDISCVGHLASIVMEKAIINGVKSAEDLHGYLSCKKRSCD